MTNRNTGYLLLVIVAVIVLFGAMHLMDRNRDEPTTALGRAGQELSEGMSDAGKELSGNKTTADKIGDAVEDAGRDLKSN